MRLGKLLAPSVLAAVVLGLQLVAAPYAAGQTVSPCCDKLCSGGTSVQCNEIALGGLGAADAAGNPAVARGCVDVELGGGLNDVCLIGSPLT